MRMCEWMCNTQIKIQQQTGGGGGENDKRKTPFV